ncbi:ABC transporter substrate-binding protein [Ruminiclostridium cellobioparum]|uniref:ABC-type sugar transport system, periplasmic component n=1 Tax=Ruminiclostridium cellobioparum subsp. termitidis CT1112 TaxID=1195236 RepID=S0FGF9_RUMCE|nr:ABC transporter substrate-binding protein [Ruminiclostridium cellobioparum]EMS70515.1 ABC-type sugar transport system, periplasmic component [Ruminiclostridium cellobioparum subsp. termitidis CT1112]
MKRKLYSLLVSVLAAALVFGGCGSQGGNPSGASDTSAVSTAGSSAQSKIDTSKEAEIVMYIIGNQSPDFENVMKEFNKKSLDDLNATLQVNYLNWGEYKTKYPLILSAGEPIDLIYTATWMNYYYQAQKGAFKPIEDLLPVYCPESYKTITEEAMKQATVNGHIYAVAGTKESYNAYGPVVRKDLMDKYGMKSIDTFDQYGDFLKAVAKNEKGMDPTFFTSTGSEIDDIYMLSKGLYPLTGNSGSIYWIDPKQEQPKVFSKTDWDGMPEFLAKMKEWSDAGCWSKSALANKDTEKMNNGTAASRIKNLEVWVSSNIDTKWDFNFYNFVEPIEILSHMQDAMAVPTSSNNTERALMLLDKIKSDKTYYNLLNFGIEGVNYKIHEDNTIESVDSTKFAFQNGFWGMQMRDFDLNKVGSPETLPQIQKEYHDTAVPNKFRSYYMDTEKIKNEYAAVQNVMEQYFNPLELGYVDPVKGLDTTQKQMKAAGNEKVLAELQAQIDKFIADNK